MTRRAIVNPNTAEAFDEMRSDYSATKQNRFRRRRTGVAPMGSGADYHYRSDADYLRMMEMARDMDRNDAIVGATIDRAVLNTVQSGIKLDPQTGDKDTDADLLKLWQDWSTDPDACDSAGELTFADMEGMCLRHQFVDGDIIANPTRGGQLELIEGHRIRTPMKWNKPATTKNVVHGVLLDKQRRRMEFWVTNDDIPPDKVVSRVGDLTRLPVRNSVTGERQLFQIYNPKRVSQTRGVTALAPIVDLLGMFEDINFAKLVQQQVVSCFAVFHQRDVEFDFHGANRKEGSQSTETLADGSSRLLEGIGPGMRITGEPGEKLIGFSPNVPNAEFFDHVKLILTLVGINLGLPLVLMLLDASETNFSGWRGAVDQARLGFKRNQKSYIRKFHRPVYRWKLREWIRDSPVMLARQKANANLFRHDWNPPTWPYIEPLKDAQADKLRLESRLISPRRQQAERGNDYERIAEEIVEDNALIISQAMKKASEINAAAKDGQIVTWRDLTRFDAPKLDMREIKHEPDNERN